MAVFDIFSKRQKKERREISPDAFWYDSLSKAFRVQVVHILRDLFGQQECYPVRPSKHAELFGAIHDVLAREYGVFELEAYGEHEQAVIFEFIQTADVEQVFDVIELSLRLANALGPQGLERDSGHKSKATLEEAVTELNCRFLEHGIGYQYESGIIVRIDSEFLHQEAVKPALHLLRAGHFAGAEKEFLEAHRKFRHQQYEDTISDSLKAFESTLKIICQRKGWVFNEQDTASRLIKIVFDHELVPKYLQSQFGSLRSVLESGVPTIRNRESGHGGGSEPRYVPAHLASYVLHLPASTIVFLGEASKD